MGNGDFSSTLIRGRMNLTTVWYCLLFGSLQVDYENEAGATLAACRIFVHKRARPRRTLGSSVFLTNNEQTVPTIPDVRLPVFAIEK